MSGETWTIYSVLKLGGDFKPCHVRTLRDMAARCVANPHRFVCLTDTYVRGVECVPLRHGWPGWWSKMELFRQEVNGPCAYFDLDIAMLQPFTLPTPSERELYMIRDFMFFETKGEMNSSAMAWSSDLSDLYHATDGEGIVHAMAHSHGDQDYILEMSKPLGVSLAPIDDHIGIKSYKVDKLNDNPPDESVQIACFHGQPRPWDVECEWVKEARDNG